MIRVLSSLTRCGYGFVIVCSLSFELLPPHGSGRKLLSKSRSGYCHHRLYMHGNMAQARISLAHKVLWLLKNIVCTHTVHFLPTVRESTFNAKLRPECGAASLISTIGRCKMF